jgi:cell division protease FtsH
MDDFNQAVERIVAGLEKKNRLLNPHERRVVAFHEMGHALVAKALPGMDLVHKISIIPRGIGALGYTIQRPTEDRFLMTRRELENKMAVLYGGRAAEMVVFGEVSTGAADDLQKITDIARAMVQRYGMEDKLGQVVFERQRHALFGEGVPDLGPREYSEDTAREIDCAVRALTNQARELALAVLRANRAALDAGAERLLETETLLAVDIPEVATFAADAPPAVPHPPAP